MIDKTGDKPVIHFSCANDYDYEHFSLKTLLS
jgi:hypothetical protein